MQLSADGITNLHQLTLKFVSEGSTADAGAGGEKESLMGFAELCEVFRSFGVMVITGGCRVVEWNRFFARLLAASC